MLIWIFHRWYGNSLVGLKNLDHWTFQGSLTVSKNFLNCLQTHQWPSTSLKRWQTIFSSSPISWPTSQWGLQCSFGSVRVLFFCDGNPRIVRSGAKWGGHVSTACHAKQGHVSCWGNQANRNPQGPNGHRGEFERMQTISFSQLHRTSSVVRMDGCFSMSFWL